MTRSVFQDLALSMVAFGLFVGLLFPVVAPLIGIPRELAHAPIFGVTCVSAGLAVGGINTLLVHFVLRPRLAAMAEQMNAASEGIATATLTGDWSHCSTSTCSLPTDSDDELGAAGASFNRVLEALSASRQVEAAVSAFTNRVSSQLLVEPLCDLAASAFCQHTGSLGAAVLAEVDGKLVVLVSRGFSDAEQLCTSAPVLRTLGTQDPLTVELPEGLSVHGGIVDFQPREALYLPLGLGGHRVGVVALASAQPLTTAQRALAETFARAFSMGLSNALVHEKLQRTAAHDPLTGCYNRRFGLTRLREEFKRSLRSRVPLGLVMFDLDHFKAVNDTYGHLVGDQVLSAVSQAVRDLLRESDLLVRYGGEEFLIVLPTADTKATGLVAERLRRKVAELVIPADRRDVRVTVSLGYTAFPDHDSGDEVELIRVADEALYAAKTGGRNRAVAGPRATGDT